MTLIALAALGLGVGFAGTVWVIIAATAWHRKRYWGGFWYTQLAVADLVAAFIIGSRLIGHPVDLTRGVSTMLLLPIIVVPPALQLHAWLKARSLKAGVTNHAE